ncbi:hypothetical protein BGZ75_006390 [Mortierella antarctica]|nr:hypothetical protein BGZ75_006390 [Mortierella antarctica]
MEPQDQAHHRYQQPQRGQMQPPIHSRHTDSSSTMQGSDSEARVHASVAHRPGPGASPVKDNVEAGSVSSSSSSSLSHPTSNNPSSSSSSKATPPTLRPPSATFLPPSSSASAAPSPSRLPGTPPANPPPRFFTRPYRRPLDHSHHHHGSTHGSGHGGGQSSSSIGVRSAFKDFVVPAQIILVCSILNALWPTMLRIVTTTLEFLVLVLSSYSACARRSDDCYFLEPLLNDGQEAIYVGTIQWALRSVFSILFLGALVFISKKLQTLEGTSMSVLKHQRQSRIKRIHFRNNKSGWLEVIWSALMNNRRRPRSFWSLDNIWSWIMTYPNLLWRLAQRIFPWRITRSSQSRSSQNTRHYRKTTSAISPTAGAHQYSGPSTAKDDCSAAIGTSPKYTQKVPSLNAVDTDTVSAGSGSESRAKAKTKSRKAKPLQGKAAMSLSRSSSGSMLGSPDSTTSPGANLQLDPKPILVPKLDLNDRVLSTVGMVSQTITEGADDDDFISTDRRRRRKTKSLKINSAANSTESLLKSGLDISIESDQEQGKHGSRSVTRPKPRIQVDLVGTQNKPSLGSFLPPSSFFESSPRTPRIMPFSQHNRNPGSSTLETEDWSVRTRSSSIAAPMTPLLEADCMDPMDYFGGSRSANSSRRGSVENNLTESLLSGRARMFANIGSAGTMSHGISQDFATSSPVDTNNTLLSGGGFLSSRLKPTGVSSPLAAFASATPPMAGQSSLDTPTLTDSSLTTGSLDAAPVFVNPWESNYPYRSNHTVSETFLPFGSSSGPGGIDQGADQGAEQGVDQGVDLDRQSSLLRLMNGNYVNGSSGTGGNTGGMNVLFKAPPSENEIDSIRKGFHRPDHARHSGLPLQQLDVTSFRPFASVEMSLAAAANQPPPLQEDPQYDLLEWTLQHQLSKPSNKASAENADSAPGRVGIRWPQPYE